MASTVLTVVIALLVLLQGGFFSLSGCALGLVVCVVAGVTWLRSPHRNANVPVVPLLFLCLSLSYFVSVLASGASLTTLSEAGVWAGCAGVSFLSAAQGDERRASWFKALVWFGIATAVAGVLVCAGVVPLAGGLVGRRLQFTFQYANAAAAWYGACAIMCLLSPDGRQRAFSALPAAAVLLTESGGALVVFAFIALVVAVSWAKSARWGDLLHALTQGVLAVVLFAGVHATMSPLALLVLAAVACACFLIAWRASLLASRLNTRMASLVLAGIFIACTLVSAWLLFGHAVEAASTFGERLMQMRDGVSLWVSQPVLGIGPDNWQYLYSYIQTAPYYTTVVHCSYIQIALDSGILGLGFFIAACALGVRGLVRDSGGEPAFGSWARANLFAVLFLLAHALVDFDFQFAALSFLLAAMVSKPGEPDIGAQVSGLSERFRVKGLAAGVLCLAVCSPLSATGALSAASATAIGVAEASGDYATCERLFSGNPLAQADVGAQSSYLSALYGQEEYDAVADAYTRLLAPTGGDALHAALAHYALGDRERATDVLADYLEQHPYDADFLDSAVQLGDAHGIDPSGNARFNAMVNQARSCIAGEGGNGFS